MADVPAEKIPVQIEPPTSFDLTVEEFCVRLSGTDKRPEMIYAFSRDEMANGRFKDSQENFQTRFASFTARPA